MSRVRGVWCVGALLLSACTTLDRAVGKVPWFTTMRDQQSVRPFEGPGVNGAPKFTPPEGSIPFSGREDSLDITTPDGLRVVDAKRNLFERTPC